MKKIVFSLILIMVICSISCEVQAGLFWNKSISDISKDFMDAGKLNDPTNGWGFGTQQTYQGFEELAGLLTGIGIWVIIIVGAVIGIRFMLASPDKKAELKKSLIIYVIGSVIIIGALLIWRVVIGLLDIY